MPLKTLNTLNFNHLYYFWVIATAGSIKKASKLLNITSPGLSGQLKQFETYLGCKLFIRKSRKLILNHQGLAVLDYSNKIFNECQRMVNEFKDPQFLKKEHLNIGMISSLPKAYLSDFTVPLLKRKNMTLTFYENYLQNLILKLENDQIDILLSDRQIHSYKVKLLCIKLMPNKLIAIGGPGSGDLKKNFPQSLEGQRMINFTQHGTIRSEIDDYLARNKITPQIIAQADDVNFIINIVKKNLCMAIVPARSAKDSITLKQIEKIGELTKASSYMWITIKKSKAQDSLLGPLLEQLLKKYGENP